MDAKDFYKNFEDITLADFAKNYDEIKKSIVSLRDKAQEVDRKYDFDRLSPQQIPDALQDFKSIISSLVKR